MRQQRQKHECPQCGADLKKTIGAQSRKKWWECTGDGCSYRRAVAAASLSSNPW